LTFRIQYNTLEYDFSWNINAPLAAENPDEVRETPLRVSPCGSRLRGCIFLLL